MCAVLCVKRNVHQRKAKQCVKLAGQKQQLKKGQTAFQKHKSEKKNKTTEDKSKCEGSEHYNWSQVPTRRHKCQPCKGDFKKDKITRRGGVLVEAHFADPGGIVGWANPRNLTENVSLLYVRFQNEPPFQGKSPLRCTELEGKSDSSSVGFFPNKVPHFPLPEIGMQEETRSNTQNRIFHCLLFLWGTHRDI